MVSLIYTRPRSEQEIRLKLKLKKVDPNEVEELVVKLKDQDLLNDQSFANWWVEGRKNSRSTSKRKLYSELAQKGIKSDIASSAIEDSFTDDDELDSLKKLINKKKDKYPDQQKLMSFLASKGFSYSSIKEALSVEDDLNF
jgi:regulatory protein